MTEPTPTTRTAQERIAFRRVRRMRDYYLHLLIYLAANAACIAINLLTSPERLWFVGLSLFWGIGLLAHTLRMFVFDRYFDGQWERAYVEKLLKRPL